MNSNSSVDSFHYFRTDAKMFSIIKHGWQKIKDKFHAMTPYELFESCRIFVNFCGRSVGVNVLGHLRVTMITYFVALALVQQVIFTNYTFYYYWGINKLSAMTPISILAISIPVI